jgi:hypothetical protein
LYDPKRHVFRTTSVAETVAALHEFDRLVETFIPDKHFIFTLSPIPLLATFRDQSAITANQSSKATLRAALNEFLADASIRARGRYHYFPAYELAFHLFGNPFSPDNRHVRPEVATSILNTFSAIYTDLPNGTTPVNDKFSEASLRRTVEQLQASLVEKERVIRELDVAARERLAIIHEFQQRDAAIAASLACVTEPTTTEALLEVPFDVLDRQGNRSDDDTGPNERAIRHPDAELHERPVQEFDSHPFRN